MKLCISTTADVNVKLKWNEMKFKNSSLKRIKNKNTKLYLVWKLPFVASDSAKKDNPNLKI